MATLKILSFLVIFIARTLSYIQFVDKNTDAVSSSTYYGHNASKAVDGNFDQKIENCSHTDDICGNDEHAWLRIDLKQEYSIKSVKIWYRADRGHLYYNMERLRGFSIRVSSDTNEPPSQSTCYTDQGNVQLNITTEAECERIARYIWIYQSNKADRDRCPMLEICEVQIFGCEKGYYGKNCSNKCVHCINNATCGIRSGRCDNLGCAQGYKATNQPPYCKSCNEGWHGKDCAFRCGHCLGPEPCHHINGSCPRDCQEGYTGENSCTSCESSQNGTNCALTCGHCLESGSCHHANGSCPMGCQEGYEGDMCNTSCRNGKYGEDCALTCGHCLGSEPCHHINGSCPRGCQKGFIGDKCLKDRSAMDVVNDNLQRFTIILFILCPVIGVVVISLCVLTNVYISRKRKRKSAREVQSKCQDTEEQVNTDIEDEESRQSLAENLLYATVQRSSKNIKTNDLLAVIKSMENNKDKGFSEEYNFSIPYGEQSFIICNVGKRQENIPKNRFKTIYPYDHSRVVLQSSTNGDYINADFIKNTNGDTAYIASQGPKPETVGDFWQMVWQENVFVIAMVTNLKEGDKKKCQRYWPLAEENEMLMGTFSIQLFSEKTYANFEVHHLKVTNKKIQEIRQITHLQYTSWPDHDSPSPLELLEYYRYVSRAMQQHPEQKLLVHCSAGIGRTGTFIALDALHRQGVEKGRINIVEYIHTMRMDRMNMIQNLSQYKFLYYALYESFQTGSHNLSKRSFVQEVDSQRQLVEYTGLSNFRMEYNDLESLKRTFNESEKQTAIQNFDLNMTKNVLPADNKRIILSSYVPGRGTYYNAVPISSFTTKDCIIAGQYPVQGAGVDLIRLLVDQDCSSLVLTHPLSEIPHSREWFSDSLLNYRVEVHPQSKLTACVNKSAVKIEQLSNKSWHKMSIYEITTWNENFPKVLLDIIRCVRIEEHIDQQNKLVVLSRDGASRCGVFCAVYNAIQQLQQDQEVDMFTIVRQLQSRRPEMISHLNEYLLCCHTVAEFIKSEPKDTYQNVPCKKDENVYANTFKCSNIQITQ